MPRYILKFRGPLPDETLARIQNADGLTIVDSAVPEAMLVDAPQEVADSLDADLPDVLVAEERQLAPPDAEPG